MMLYYYYWSVHFFLCLFYVVPVILLIAAILTIRKLREYIDVTVKDKDPEAVQSKRTASFILKARIRYDALIVKKRKKKYPITRVRIKRSFLFRLIFVTVICVHIFINYVVLPPIVLSGKFKRPGLYRYDILANQFESLNTDFLDADSEDYGSFEELTEYSFSKLHFKIDGNTVNNIDGDTIYYLVLKKDRRNAGLQTSFEGQIHNGTDDTVYAELKGQYTEGLFMYGNDLYYAYGSIRTIFYTKYFYTFLDHNADIGECKTYKVYHFAKLDLSTKEVTNVEKEEFEEKYYSVIDNYRLREE